MRAQVLEVQHRVVEVFDAFESPSGPIPEVEVDCDAPYEERHDAGVAPDALRPTHRNGRPEALQVAPMRSLPTARKAPSDPAWRANASSTLDFSSCEMTGDDSYVIPGSRFNETRRRTLDFDNIQHAVRPDGDPLRVAAMHGTEPHHQQLPPRRRPRLR